MEQFAQTDIETQLAEVPLFGNLSPAELAMVAVGARKINITKGNILFHKDDPCHGFYLIISGKIKLAFISAAGNEKVIEILMPGQTFGEAVMFMERPFPLSAQALCNASLILVSKHAVFQALDSNPLLARKLITGLSVRLHRMVQNHEFNSMRSGKQRVADYLLRCPVVEDTDTPLIQLPANKLTIAAHLGITPEHFSRILHEMCDVGLISVQGKNIHILSSARLKELLSDLPDNPITQRA